MTPSHDQTQGPTGNVRKTLAIRLEEAQHAQLTMIAQLEELTVTDAIRQAIDQWIETKRTSPQLQQRAEAVLADIEREANTRRGAVAALLGNDIKAPTSARKEPTGGGQPSPRSSRSKGGEPATS
jgi:hypothetical protein